jgi:hypothetical protein
MPWAATKKVRLHLKLDPTDRNPDQDINPPLQYMIQLGTKRPDGTLENESTAYVYQPNGKCVGTLSKECLLKLQSQYEQTKATHPQLHTDLGATTFSQDTAKHSPS